MFVLPGLFVFCKVPFCMVSALYWYAGGGPYILGALPPNCLHAAKPRRHKPVAMLHPMILLMFRFMLKDYYCCFSNVSAWFSMVISSLSGSDCSRVSSTANTGTGPYTSGSGVNMVRLHDANPNMQRPAYIIFSMNDECFITVPFLKIVCKYTFFSVFPPYLLRFIFEFKYENTMYKLGN